MTKTNFQNLMIELTNNCNLSCPICPTGSGEDKRGKGFMNFGQFKRIIDSSENFLNFLQISGYGEPFLSPDIGKMIKYAGEEDVCSGVFTNGVVLNKKEMDVFKNNYKFKITFSIDGINQKSYRYYRKGGNLKKVLSNLSYLVNLKDKYGLFNLEIIWQFLIMKMNEDQIEDARKLADKIGVDQFKLKTISIYESHLRYFDFVPENKKYQRKKETKEKCLFTDPGMPFILWNGDVVPCCVGYKKEYIMGNALKGNLIDIWGNKKYKKFRKDNENGVNFLCNKRCRYN